ncbi:MAG TPA: GNAT family N-acetyltransferase [Actinobacteria bacterium]|nr:GNAT family N-acetyltransferase [Actinomycetota bacterium]
MINLREAGCADNQALSDLEMACPQGKDVKLLLEREDFFARSKMYERAHTFVAEEEGKVVGVISCAFKDVNLNGATLKANYIYDLRVHPDFRRRGIATKLVDAVEILARENSVDFGYGFIVDDNTAPRKLLVKKGFSVKRRFELPTIQISRKRKVQKVEVKLAQSRENIARVSEVLSEYYRNYSFFISESEDKYFDRVSKMNSEGVFYAEGDGGFATVSILDYSKIFNICVLDLPITLKLMGFLSYIIRPFLSFPNVPKKGGTIKQWYLFDVGFSEKEGEFLFQELLDYVNNLAVDKGIDCLVCAIDTGNPAHKILSKRALVKLQGEIIMKPYTKSVPNKITKVYLDVRDL